MPGTEYTDAELQQMVIDRLNKVKSLLSAYKALDASSDTAVRTQISNKLRDILRKQTGSNQDTLNIVE